MIKSIPLFTVFLLSVHLVLAAQPGHAEQAGQASTTDPASEVKKLVSDFDGPETPGGFILVMRDGEVIYQHAFGMANLTHGIPFETTTPTNIGSTAKQFTGFAIALLEERGMLSMEDDVRKHIPELPDLGHTVRLKHLLSHTSGYREYLNSFAMSGRFLQDHLGREEIIPLVQRQPRLQNEPGASRMYNNTGWALLAMVVERVTGETFPGWMKENVFEPLGMNHTCVRDLPQRVIPGSAQGYTPDSAGVYLETQDLYAAMGAGGIYTTAGDLVKWVNNFFEPRLGSPGLIKKMQTPFVLNNGNPTNYGLGLIIDDYGGLKRLQHDGADAAHRSNLLIFPEIKGAVITQSNNASFPGNTADKVAELFFRDVMQLEEKEAPAEPVEFVFDPDRFDDFAGRYELEVAPGFIMEFTREGDKYFTQPTGQGKHEIFASSDSTFYLTVVEASMTFHRNEDGMVNEMTLHQNGNHRALKVLEPKWEPSEQDVAEYLGRYYSDELETYYTVAQNDENKLVLSHRRLSDIPLTTEKKDVFTGTFPIFEISFVRDESGKVTGFEASSGRSFGIEFLKQ